MRHSERILFLSDRQARHDCDYGFEVIGRNFSDFQFRYPIGGYGRLDEAWAKPLSMHSKSSDFDAFDIVYCRLDHYHKLLKSGVLFEILDLCPRSKFILGYHCHLAKPFDLEQEAFRRADALVLLNEGSQDYFLRAYPEISGKPVFFLNSLYLPPRRWYGEFGRKSSWPDTAAIALVSTQHVAMSRPHRYNSIRQIEMLLMDPKNEVDVFGGFPDDATERIYRGLKGNIRLIGRVPEHVLDALMPRYAFSPMNGFLPGEKTPAFEHMNYAMRFNSLLKARTVPVMASGTCAWHETEARDTGFGVVIEHEEELSCLFDLKNRTSLTEAEWTALVERHAIETYAEDLASFFASV